MMSLSTIREESRKAARVAAKALKVPFVVEKEDLEDWKAGNFSLPLPFPFLGDYVPKQWERTDRDSLFVDSSGFGSDGELALNLPRFLESLQIGKGYAIIEAGQFQVYIAEYEKV